MTDTFTPGTRVRLKSGGPTMTVDRIARHGESAECIWFIQGDELCRAWFTLTSLDALNPSNTNDDEDFDGAGRLGQD